MRDFIVTDTSCGEKTLTCAALYEDGKLNMLRAEEYGPRSRVGEVFRGCVDSVAANIGGAFIKDGRGGTFFLPLKKSRHEHGKTRHETAFGRIVQSQPLLVQVRKDASGLKEAVVTEDIEIAGRYAVVSRKPGKTSFSAKLSAEQKDLLRKWVDDSPCPEFHLTVRTNAAYAEKGALLEEITALADTLKGILSDYEKAGTGTVLYRPYPFYIEALRDLYELPDRCFSDIPSCREMMEALFSGTDGAKPEVSEPLRGQLSLAELYHLPEDLLKLGQKRVWLKSGAFIVIEQTEAFVSIDVNTGRSAKGRIPEETYRRVNLEAAAEIALQMNLRNLSGMILVDFISLENPDHREELVNVMKKLVRKDRIHTEVIDLTPLGIMEIVRQKVRKPLAEVLSL